jgi:hypothetical protein
MVEWAWGYVAGFSCHGGSGVAGSLSDYRALMSAAGASTSTAGGCLALAECGIPGLACLAYDLRGGCFLSLANDARRGLLLLHNLVALARFGGDG